MQPNSGIDPALQHQTGHPAVPHARSSLFKIIVLEKNLEMEKVPD